MAVHPALVAFSPEVKESNMFRSVRRAAGTRNHCLHKPTAKGRSRVCFRGVALAEKSGKLGWLSSFQGGEKDRMNVELWRWGRRWQSHDPGQPPLQVVFITTPCLCCPSLILCNLGFLLNSITSTSTSKSSTALHQFKPWSGKLFGTCSSAAQPSSSSSSSSPFPVTVSP